MTADLRAQLQATLGDTYTIERELGGGGMSRLFVAEERSLGRRVAIKVLAPEIAAGLNADRFAREIRLAARLQHPHIVPLLSAGTAGDLPYYTMPFVEGKTLRDRLAGDPISIAEARSILRDVALALEYAHEHWVVHRDIKPENVLLTGRTAVVTDFGIGKALSASRTQADPATVTYAGTVIGTPAYMAPEQAVGDPQADHRTDLYAWGVMAYEMLTGAHPFAGRASAQELLGAHLSETPVPIGEKRPEVPEALRDLVMRCLAKGPAERPAAARLLLDCLDTIPLTSQDGTFAAVRRLSGLRGRRLAVGVGALVLLTIGIHGLWQRGSGTANTRGEGRASPAEPIRSLAVLPLVNVGGDSTQEFFADGITDELTTALAKLPGVRVAARSSAFTFKGQQGLDGREAGRRLGVSAVLEGSLRREGSRMRLNVQLTSVAGGLVLWSDGFQREVKDAFAVQTEVATAIASALRITIGMEDSSRVFATQTTSPELYDRYLLGKYFVNQGAREGLEKGLGLFREVRARDSLYARAYSGIALAYFWLADAYLPPKEAYPKMIEAATHAIQLDPDLAEAHGLLAAANLLYAWDWEAARQEADRALALNPNEATARQVLMMSRLIDGDSTGALVAAREWVRTDPLSPITNHVAAYYMTLAGGGDSAVAQARRAEAIAPGLVYEECFSGYALLANGLYPEALALLERAARTLGHPTAYLAVAYARTGRRADAEQVLRGLEARWGREYLVPEYVAAAWATLGNYQRAFTWLERGSEAHSALAPTIVASPEFAPMRQDPRFRRLLDKLHLAPR